MTRRAKPNNIKSMFIEVTPMMSMNLVALISAILTCIWFYNLAFLNSVHQSSSGFYSIWIFCFTSFIVGFSNNLTTLSRAIFTRRVSRFFFGRTIALYIQFTFQRISKLLSSRFGLWRLFIFFYTRLTSLKPSVYSIFISIKIRQWFELITSNTSFGFHKSPRCYYNTTGVIYG